MISDKEEKQIIGAKSKTEREIRRIKLWN